jgi:N-acetylglucosamine malate deacetylase 2
MTVTDEQITGFLHDLPRGQADASRTAIVVAHPDDETIGIGAHLARLRGVRVVHLTDGAPADMADARANGIATRQGYAAARRAELSAAMALAGIPPSQLVALGVADQQAAYALPALARRLAGLFETLGLEIVLTHPFEGGHPDHDATCFAVHAAASLLARRHVSPPALLEMAFYHCDGSCLRTQRFPAACATDEWRFALSDADWARKQRMLAAFVTQHHTLSLFTDRCERLRIAPAYDFIRLPNNGRLYYERFPWGLTGAAWQTCAVAALSDLGLQGCL